MTDPINVNASCSLKNSWVGLYKADDNPSSATKSICWYNTSEHNGEEVDIKQTTVNDREILEGEYKIILFADQGYSNKLDTKYINVETPTEESVLSLEKKEFEVGEPINVSATSEYPWSWVGLYSMVDGDLSNQYYYYSNLSDFSGPINILEGKEGPLKGLSTGEYRMILFKGQGYNVDKIVRFTIKDSEATTTELSETTTNDGEDSTTGEVDITTNPNEEITTISEQTTVSDKYSLSVSSLTLLIIVLLIIILLSLSYSDVEYDAGSGGVDSFYWYYVGDYPNSEINMLNTTSNGRAGFTGGDYQLVLFGDGGYGNVLKKIDITIKPQEEITNLTGSMTLDKETYTIGEPIYVTANTNNPYPESSWVGFYKEDDDTSSSGHVEAMYWCYLSNAENPFDITEGGINPSRADDMGEGEYKLVLYGTSDWSKSLVIKHIALELPQDVDFSLDTDKKDYLSTDPILVTATCSLTNAWVGLYKEEDSPGQIVSLCWFYVRNHDGAYNIKEAVNTERNEPLKAGTYKIILFGDGGYNYQLATKEITITRTVLNRNVIRSATCMNDGLEEVEYADNPGSYELEVIPAYGHTFADAVWEYNADTHTHIKKCSICHGEEEEGTIIEECKFDNPEKQEDGRLKYTCSVCGGEYIKDSEVENLTTNESTSSQIKETTTKVANDKAIIKEAYKKKSAKKIKIKLNKLDSVAGYKICVYKTKNNAKKHKKAIVTKYTKKTNYTIKSKKLKNKKKLYVSARTYKLKKKTKVYGSWSKVVKVKIK